MTPSTRKAIENRIKETKEILKTKPFTEWDHGEDDAMRSELKFLQSLLRKMEKGK